MSAKAFHTRLNENALCVLIHTYLRSECAIMSVCVSFCALGVWGQNCPEQICGCQPSSGKTPESQIPISCPSYFLRCMGLCIFCPYCLLSSIRISFLLSSFFFFLSPFFFPFWEGEGRRGDQCERRRRKTDAETPQLSSACGVNLLMACLTTPNAYGFFTICLLHCLQVFFSGF